MLALRRRGVCIRPVGHTDPSLATITEVWAFTEGHVERFWPEAEGAASRRDDTDRSLARSAWKPGKASLETSKERKNRPVGYGVIGRG